MADRTAIATLPDLMARLQAGARVVGPRNARKADRRPWHLEPSGPEVPRALVDELRATVPTTEARWEFA